MPLRLFRSDGREKIHAKGEDQLHSFEQVLCEKWEGTISGANGYYESGGVPAGKIWHITRVIGRDVTNALTAMTFRAYHGADLAEFYNPIKAIAAGEYVPVAAEFWLDTDDLVRVIFTGGQANDTVSVALMGEQFTLET